MSQSTSSANEDTRNATAGEIKDIRDALFDAGNARSGKLYLFSGIKSLTPAIKHNHILQPAKVELKRLSRVTFVTWLMSPSFRLSLKAFRTIHMYSELRSQGPGVEHAIKFLMTVGRIGGLN